MIFIIICLLFYYETVIFFSATVAPFDSDHMARIFLMAFHHCAFTIGQELVFQYTGPDEKKTLFAIKIKDMEGKPHFLK